MTLNNKTYYTDIQLMNGTVCAFIIPNAANYSRAIRKQQKQEEFDLFLFLIEEFCIFDGKKFSFEQVCELGCDDYLKIIEVIGRIVTPIK